MKEASETPQWKEAWGLHDGEHWYGVNINGSQGVLTFHSYYAACIAARQIEKDEGGKLWPERIV